MGDAVVATAPADTARRLYEALATGDRDTLDAILHPDFVGNLAAGMPFGVGGEHRGAEAMRRDGWGGIRRHFAAKAEPERYLPLADGRLLVTGRYRGHARRGGGEVDAGFAHLITVGTDGRLVALDQYTDTARWSAAVSPYRTLTLDVSEGLATMRLDRPEQQNTIDVTMVEDIGSAAATLAADRSVRAVLLTGNGPMFSGGGDIDLFTNTPAAEFPDLLDRMVSVYHLAIERLTAIDAPVVAAVRGAAAGGGLGLVCAADVVVAAEDAVFATGYGAIGLTSDGGNTWFLPRLIGMRRTQELFFTNRRLSAAEALDWGLVTSVVPADEVEAAAENIARRLAGGPTQAYGRIRRLLRQSLETDMHDQLYAEERQIVLAAGSTDAVEGVNAFAEHRRPTFTGH
jgi:2-(1,2-epoxy-1,2-dihydrophenyl)acetyl-CoA isomerase